MKTVYVVLASEFPVVFEERDQAEEYADLAGNGPVVDCALRSRVEAEELLGDFREAL